MDGRNRATIHSRYVYRADALTLDIPSQTLYWADNNYNRVEKSNVDGTNRVVLAHGVYNPSGIVYDAELQTLFFTAYYDIKYLNASGSPVSLHSASLYVSQVVGIQIVDPWKQQLGTYFI